MFENYKYVFPGTNIHLITFSIIAFEIVVLVYQLIFFLYRPSDKSRLWYLILLILLIIYNIAGGLFPDPRLSISIFTQNILSYATGILMCIYVPFYVYKFLGIKSLRFYAYYGSLFFLFLPFILAFVIPYSITKDIELSRKMLVIAPSIYGVSLFFSLIQSIIKKNADMDTPHFREKLIGMFISLIFWIGGLSMATIFKSEQIVEHSITNMGFLIMSVIFVRSTIIDSRQEYRKLMDSEQQLQLANELLQMKVTERTKELELANEQRILSFISLAHEVRTPITLIRNYLDDYIRQNGNSKELQIIKSNIEKLNSDIINTFNEERVLKGFLPDYNHKQIVDLSLLLHTKVPLFNKYAVQKSLRFKADIDDNIFIEANPEALDSIVNNLVENAIKYTSSEGLIRLSLTSEEKNIYLIVEDSGPSIPNEMQSKIFEPYVRVLNENSPSGLGLGLSIVKNIVNSLNGDIQLKSEVNKGSTFTIVLKKYNRRINDEVTPYMPKNPVKMQLQEQEIKELPSDPAKSTVLLIEDNQDLLTYLKNKLEAKYNVNIALNGRKALERLAQGRKPDIIISDVMMDEMDGFQFYKSISENNQFSHIPLIFLTAKTTETDKLYGLDLGALDYIHKPFSIQELISKIDSILLNSRKQKSAVLHSAVDSLLNTLNDSRDEATSKAEKFETNCKTYKLTDREKEIIKLIQRGLSYKEISTELNLSDNTLVTHRQNIFRKVNVNSKVDLINKIFN